MQLQDTCLINSIKTYIVGVTGGIACGKTSVTDCFKALKVPVVDADVIAREAVAPGQPVLAQLAQSFGHEILKQDGSLDRFKLRQLVFADETKLKQLNALLHPEIRSRIIKALAAIHAPYALLCAPLLFENHLEHLVRRVLVIDTDPKLQLQRICERDKCSEATARGIIAHQLPRAERVAKADDLIVTDQSPITQLRPRVLNLHHQYLKLSAAASLPSRQDLC